MATQVAISHDVTQLVDRIKEVKVATLTAQHKLHSRPMYTTVPESDGTLWFFCEKDSEKIREIQRCPEINLGYNDPSGDT